MADASSFVDDRDIIEDAQESNVTLADFDFEADLEADVSESRRRCCVLPTRQANAGGSISGSGGAGGLQKKRGIGYDFTWASSSGDVVLKASTGKVVILCSNGKKVRAASPTCGMLPIADGSSGWNALGFNLPSITLTMFGMTLNIGAKIVDNLMKDLSGATGIPGKKMAGGGMCFASQIPGGGCGNGFAIAQSGMLSAKCTLMGSVPYCGPGIKSGAPSITVTFLSVAFSPERSLSQKPAVGFWTGNGALKSALARPRTFPGVFAIMGATKLSAFDFQGLKVMVMLVGKMILDVKLDPVRRTKEVFKSLMAGDINRLINAASVPFQFTLSGTFKVTVALAPAFTFGFSPGGAGITFGFQMARETGGASDGFFAAANFNLCLSQMVPPLASDFFKCHGKNVFTKICVSSAAGLFLSKKGFGFKAQFSLNLASWFHASWEMGISTSEADIAASVGGKIGSKGFSVRVRVGFTFSKRSAARPYVQASLPGGAGAVLKACASIANSIVSDLTKTVKGWFGEMQLELPEAAGQPRKLLNAAAAGDAVKRRRRWNKHRWHKHHPHRWHAHHPHRWHVHAPHMHFNVGSVSIKFEKAEMEASICAIMLKLSVKVSASVGGAAKSAKFSFSVKFGTGDLQNAIKSAINSAFGKLKRNFQG